MPALSARPDAPPSQLVRAAQERLLGRLRGDPPDADDAPTSGGPSIAQPPTHWPGPTRLAAPDDADPRYEFGEAFAAGGLGLVRRAEDRRLGRTVAVKELLRSDPDAERRFAIEAAITARLQHPGIVPLYDIGRHASGEPYYCMKLVDGESLELRIRRARAPGERLALLEHVIAAADAIAYAHRHGVIHRDLKPANILVGELGETVVIDWGLAKDLTGRLADLAPPPEAPPAGGDSSLLTRSGTVLGTLRYMPPEQARGEPADPRSDVFALGAVLLHVLSGKPPHAGVDDRELARRVAAGVAPEVRALAPEAPRELAAIAQRALAPLPEDRYASAEAFAEDLRRFLTGRLVDAHRYSPGEVARLWLRKHRALAAVSAASLLALGIGGGLAVEQIRQERDLATAAQAQAEAALGVAREQTGAAVLAHARGLLDEDLPAALRALASADLSDETALRRARLLALAAEERGAPDRVLHGHARPVQQMVALTDGSLVSIDIGGAVRRWDPQTGAGAAVLELDDPRAHLVAARDVPMWAVKSGRSAHVFRGDRLLQVVDTSAIQNAFVDMPAHSFATYRWELSADGQVLAALGEPLFTQDERGATAYLFDLRQQPAAMTTVPVERAGLAVMSPDGAALAFDGEGFQGQLYADGRVTALPGMGRPFGFSRDGASLVAARRGEPRGAVVWTRATGETRPLGETVLALTPEDAALVLEFGGFLGTARLSLRDLAGGEPRWEYEVADSYHRMEWGERDAFDLAVDPHGGQLAVRHRDHWRLGARADGELSRRLDIGVHRQARWLPGGRFAVVHQAQIWVWDPPAQTLTKQTASALSSDGARAIVPGPGGAPVLLDMSSGTTAPIACLAGSPLGPISGTPDLAVDGHGRVLRRDRAGAVCLQGRDGEARALELPAPARAVALAAGGEAYAVGLDDGTLLAWRGAAELGRWSLGSAAHAMWPAPEGDVIVARTDAGELLALQPGDASPTELARLGPGIRAGVAVHPRGVAVAVALSEGALRIHDVAADTAAARVLALPNAPVLAYSPTGARLAVATAGRGLLLLAGADDPGRELTLPEEAHALAFVGEDELAAVSDAGALLRVDARAGEAALVRRGWLPETDATLRLVARPDGALAAFDGYTLHQRPADEVPRDAADFRDWLAARSRELAAP